MALQPVYARDLLRNGFIHQDRVQVLVGFDADHAKSCVDLATLEVQFALDLTQGCLIRLEFECDHQLRHDLMLAPSCGKKLGLHTFEC